ncbi:MAG TPA: hypothetical protein VEY51_02685, partial [Chondromyces sp.]|nr:hypothetical protein [Chondromyces sp.]
NSCRQEFYSYEHLCMEPELSSVTWHGTLAESFDYIREGGMLASYQDIENRQFSLSLQVLADKIRQIEAEIAAIRAAIAAMKDDD